MSGHVPSVPMPAIEHVVARSALPMPAVASIVGASLLVVFWTVCLLGPVALAGAAARVLGLEPGTCALLATLSVAATVFAYWRAVINPNLWRGM